LPHLGQSVLFEVSIIFLRSAVLAILAIVLILSCSLIPWGPAGVLSLKQAHWVVRCGTSGRNRGRRPSATATYLFYNGCSDAESSGCGLNREPFSSYS